MCEAERRESQGALARLCEFPVAHGGAQMKAVTTAPYYAMKVGVSVLGTMASLKCDEQCRILNNAGEAIENLYGAGEVIFGNLFVQEYVASGCAMGCAVYTGAIAAEDALTAIAK